MTQQSDVFAVVYVETHHVDGDEPRLPQRSSGKSPPLSCTVRFERRTGVPNPLQRIQAIPMTTKTLQEIENNGSEAYWAKQDRDANPHTEGTPESNSWYSGWDQADEENDDADPTRLCYECDQPIEECQCEDDDDDNCPECELPPDDCACRYKESA